MKKLLVIAVLLWSASAVAAPVPAYLHYQGYLTDVEGTPVSGDWTVAFKFYSQGAGGTAFFTEVKELQADLGLFSAILGTSPENPLAPAFFEDTEAWLELTVGPNGQPGVTLQPRQRVVSHPYSLWSNGASQCREADNALSFGGAAPEAYVTLSNLPQLCITDGALAAKIAALGIAAYGDAEVAAYLTELGIGPYGDEQVAAYLAAQGIESYGDAEVAAFLDTLDLGNYGDVEVAAYLAANGYLPGGISSWDDLQGKPEDLLTESGALASGLFLLADGSVVATGDLDLGGYSLLNVVIENASAAEAPEAPVTGQLWYDTDEHLLKVYGEDAWSSLGMASGLDCVGCVDEADVAFPYAQAGAKGGAALKALSLECTGCLDETQLDIPWAMGIGAGGAAADLDCEGCVTLGALEAGVLTAANVAFNDAVAGLGATTVAKAVEKLDQSVDAHGTRLDKLEIAAPGNMNEGNGTVIPFNMIWDIPPQGQVRQNFHVFNPGATPKVLLYLNSADAVESEPLGDKIVTGNWGANAYSALTASAKAAASTVLVGDGAVFKKGDAVMLYQIVTATDAPAGTWEVAKVKSVVGNSVTLINALSKSFTHCGETCGLAQMVRVERFKSLVVESGGTVVPSDDLATHETKGGIVAIMADSITVRNGGRIHANGQGFEPGDSYQTNTSGYSETGHSECNTLETRFEQSANCSGGGAAHVWCCDAWSQGGGGGGGNRTAGTRGSGNNYGAAGNTKGDAGLNTMHFGGGGGYAYPSSGGAGGGIILLAARTVTVEAGGLVEAQGGDGASFTTQSQRGGGGGGAGGTVAVFTDSFTNQGTVRAQGGKGGDGYSDYDGGAGGEGWILTNGSAEKFTIASLPSDIHILLDGTDITAQVGDPNNMGDPNWLASGGWGNGIDSWSTGELDLSTLGTWALGRHTLELREDGGVGGTLEMALYMIYPFTASYAPNNDTCTAPMLLGLDDGSEVVVGTTEDSMGRIKAIDDFKQATCGGDGGPDVVYRLTLTDWRQLTVDVASSFTPRVYLRKGDCNTGELVACGGANLVTPDLKTNTYYLFVDGDGNQEKGNFTLSVTSIPPPPAANDTCAGAIELILDENNKAQVYGVSLFSKDDFAPGCTQVGAKDLVYKVEVPAGFETLRAVVETADFSPAVYIANGSCGTIWVTCVPGKTATISWPNAGTYYIVVDGKTVNDAGEFTLKVELVLPVG